MSGLIMNGVSHAYFGRTVLDQIALAVSLGECVALVGPSGSGKSTLLHIGAGLITPIRGQVVRAYRRHAVVFQEPRLLDWKDARGNIGYVLGNLTSRARATRISAVSKAVELTPGDLTKFPVELSGGMRQRVAIARALAIEPDFVFLDEPFSALDVGLRQRMQDLAVGALLQRGAGVLFVTHDLMEAARIAHRILVLAPDGSRIAGERLVDGAPLSRDAHDTFAFAQRCLNVDPLFAHLNDVEERRAS